MRRLLWSVAIAALGGLPVAAAADESRRNVFDDPFVQLTRGLGACPVPVGPLLTEAEARAQAHGRIERGTSCYRAGRCRLPNSYLYDKEIMPRVQKAVEADGRFERTTSVWATGQRRWLWLQGCVSTADESQALETLVRAIDDVEGVVNELVVAPVLPSPSR
ncbi:BON domain-containing protein [Ideonella sp.]|uniref:BON domain-containing protein n=1 Tax=Ideonella sp. TaxID=1929293 RepID=UPI002B478B90|nr:BON domain-containing protein [Ideonella sp.]HJV68932.1 BON domain-containing protein [Ideonella sp.]